MKKLFIFLSIMFLIACTENLEQEYQKRLADVNDVPEAIDMIWDVVGADPDESRRRLAWLWDHAAEELPNGEIFRDPCVRIAIISIAVSRNVNYVEQLFYVKKIAARKNNSRRIQMCLMDAMGFYADDESIIYLSEKATGDDIYLRNRALEKLEFIKKHGSERQKKQLNHITDRYGIQL